MTSDFAFALMSLVLGTCAPYTPTHAGLHSTWRVLLCIEASPRLTTGLAHLREHLLSLYTVQQRLHRSTAAKVGFLMQ